MKFIEYIHSTDCKSKQRKRGWELRHERLDFDENENLGFQKGTKRI